MSFYETLSVFMLVIFRTQKRSKHLNILEAFSICIEHSHDRSLDIIVSRPCVSFYVSSNLKLRMLFLYFFVWCHCLQIQMAKASVTMQIKN